MKFKKLKYVLIPILVSIIFIPFLASCEGAIDGANASSVINLIFPNLWVALAQIIATIILLSTIVALVWTPYQNMMQARKEEYMKDLNEANESKKAALLDEQKAAKAFITAQSQASQIVIDANKNAEEIATDIKNKADLKAQAIINNAKTDMAIEKKEQAKNMHNQIIDVAFATAEELTKKTITKEDHLDFVNDFISKMKEDK